MYLNNKVLNKEVQTDSTNPDNIKERPDICLKDICVRVVLF